MSVVVVAPFWPMPGHVGVYRIDRFVRWLAGAGERVVLVRGGRHDSVAAESWGTTITVGDPLRFFPDRYEGVGPRRARPLVLRRIAALALSPDPSILWALRAARHPLVLEHAAGAGWVLSSNPPESAHVAAAPLARRIGARFVADMRDGWLDEPPRPELRDWRWRRWQEGRTERAILAQADRILVTSCVWGEMLVRRLPFAAPKVRVLPNGYPPPTAWPAATPTRAPVPGECRLLHAGRFSGSRAGRALDDLLAPLEAGMRASTVRGIVSLVGELTPAELRETAAWRERLGALGWRLEVEPPVDRATLLRRYLEADGLLLLDPSRAVIPSKLFEYIPARRPIFAVAPDGSAIAGIVESLPQGFRAGTDREAGASAPVAASFLAACVDPAWPSQVPDEFGDAEQSRRFLDALEIAVPRES